MCTGGGVNTGCCHHMSQPSAHFCVDADVCWHAPGACTQVEVSTLDVADLDQTHALIKLADSQAPVGGIFHLAMILSDRFMTNQVHTPCPHLTFHPLSNHCNCVRGILSCDKLFRV